MFQFTVDRDVFSVMLMGLGQRNLSSSSAAEIKSIDSGRDRLVLFFTRGLVGADEVKRLCLVGDKVAVPLDDHPHLPHQARPTRDVAVLERDTKLKLERNR